MASMSIDGVKPRNLAISARSTSSCKSRDAVQVRVTFAQTLKSERHNFFKDSESEGARMRHLVGHGCKQERMSRGVH